jgi:hypothetical protein
MGTTGLKGDFWARSFNYVLEPSVNTLLRYAAVTVALRNSRYVFIPACPFRRTCTAVSVTMVVVPSVCLHLSSLDSVDSHTWHFCDVKDMILVEQALRRKLSSRLILFRSSYNHLRHGLPSGLLPSGFPTNNLYAFLSPISSSSTSLFWSYLVKSTNH